MKFWDIFLPLTEISAIAVLIYYLLSFFWNTRAMDLVIGLFAFLFVYMFTSWIKLPVIQKMLENVANYAALALLIIFQPEIRLTLSKLNFKNGKGRDISEFDHFLEQLSQAIYNLAEKRIGALVILENQSTLEEFANNAVRIDAKFSPELLESLFITTTPLHDGGIIIRGDRIVSAATILPLADDSTQVSRSMGTRHRAGLGISQITDALIIVVSEETGRVSIARDGIMTRGIKVDRFKGVIKSIFTPVTLPSKTKWGLFKRIAVWKQ